MVDRTRHHEAGERDGKKTQHDAPSGSSNSTGEAESTRCPCLEVLESLAEVPCQQVAAKGGKEGENAPLLVLCAPTSACTPSVSAPIRSRSSQRAIDPLTGVEARSVLGEMGRRGRSQKRGRRERMVLPLGVSSGRAPLISYAVRKRDPKRAVTGRTPTSIPFLCLVSSTSLALLTRLLSF